MVMARQKRNNVSALKDVNGNKLTTYEQISDEAVNFFQTLLGTVDPKLIGCSEEILVELLPRVVSVERVSELVKEVTQEEVKASMFSIDGGKAPGPDGFT